MTERSAIFLTHLVDYLIVLGRDHMPPMMIIGEIVACILMGCDSSKYCPSRHRTLNSPVGSSIFCERTLHEKN